MTPALLTSIALATLPGDRAPRDLVALVCQAEHCRADDVGRVVGPMQVSLRWAGKGRACAGLRLREAWDSVECGVRLLAMGKQTCGDWLRGLGWYHSGRCVADGYARRLMARWQRAARKATT